LHTLELYLFSWKAKMAQLMVEKPLEDAVESAFTQVPSKDHWFQYSISPDDFDAEKVWTVIQRFRTLLYPRSINWHGSS
jgi:hypothetical protein